MKKRKLKARIKKLEGDIGSLQYAIRNLHYLRGHDSPYAGSFEEFQGAITAEVINDVVKNWRNK